MGNLSFFSRKKNLEYYQFSVRASKAEFLVLTHLRERDFYCDTEKYLKVQKERTVGENIIYKVRNPFISNTRKITLSTYY